MAFPTQNLQVSARQLAKFTSRFSAQNAPNLQKLAACYLAGVQEWQNAIWAVLEGRFLANATGIDLDVIGDLVGQERTGLDDNTYRAAIRLRIKANRSQGRSEDVIQIALLAAQKLTGDANGAAKYRDVGIYSFEVTVTDLLYPAILQSILSEARAAASRGRLIYSVSTADKMLRFSSVYSSSAGNRAFSSVYGGTVHDGKMYGALSL